MQSTGTNPGSWGAGTPDSLNEGVMEIVDANLGGITALSLTGVDVSLSQTQCNNGMLRMTGALVGNVTVGPTLGATMSGFFYFENLTTNSAFNVTFSNTGGSVVLPQGRRGTMWVDTIYGPRVISSVGSTQTDVIPAGSVVTFYNSAAPTGYTIVSLNDYALKVVSSGGGASSGSVAYSTLFGRTSVEGYTLQIADIPSHGHGVSGGTVAGTSPITGYGGGPITGPQNAATITIGNTGGSGSHTHAIDMRVQTAAVILCTRN